MSMFGKLRELYETMGEALDNYDDATQEIENCQEELRGLQDKLTKAIETRHQALAAVGEIWKRGAALVPNVEDPPMPDEPTEEVPWHRGS